MYTIYKITSPSGKSYIGLTKMEVKERWRKHRRRAFLEDRNHPFYNAIRKYREDAFKVEEIDYAPDKPSAQALEMRYIAEHSKALLYNLSPGGEADGEAGSKIFWDEINSNPEKREAYITKLSEVKKENDWTDYDDLIAKALEWRKNNPREAYKLARRGLRFANKVNRENAPSRPEDDRDRKTKLMWRYKRGEIVRENTLRQWANRTEEEKADLAAKISESVKKDWAKIKDPKVRSEKTKAARAAIDREKQAEAASKGQKKFWTELKKDPERYAEYMSKRTASLLKTLKEQGKKVA